MNGCAWRRANNLGIVDPLRERALMEKITEDSANDMAYYNRMLFSLLMEMSADHQRQVTHTESRAVKEIRQALKDTSPIFPEMAVVACQGVQGAYSQDACERFFKMPKIVYTKNFKGVFAAIDEGLCRYGVLPVENSTAGSVNRVYDLMRTYDFHIVKSIKIKIEHSLLVNKGVQKADIKEFPEAKITVCENTAAAAKYLSESGRRDAAALGAEINGAYYSLESLERAVQDSDNNYTRFICITKPLEIYPGANKTSFMCNTDHTPGSLYKVLSAINACGINITKLESRPIPGSDFDFLFYFDFEESVYTEQFIRLMNHLEGVCKDFRYLGSYIEV